MTDVFFKFYIVLYCLGYALVLKTGIYAKTRLLWLATGFIAASCSLPLISLVLWDLPIHLVQATGLLYHIFEVLQSATLLWDATQNQHSLQHHTVN